MNPMGRIQWKELPVGLYLSLVLSLLVFPAGIYLWPEPFDAIDAKIYDFKLGVRGPIEIDPNIVHLDVDDDSVEKHGMWPWDRKISGKIIDKLTEFGAKTIVFDIFFPTVGKNPSGDTILFKSIASSKRVISATALQITRTGDPDARVRVDDKEEADALYEKSWPLEPSPSIECWWVDELPTSFVPLVPIIHESQFVGHITAAADRDGVHRRVPLLIRFTDRYVPSLSLAALASYLNVEPKNIAFTKSGSLSIKRESGVLEIPLERDGSLTVNWPYKEESFPHYPATDLLDEEGSPRLKDRYKGKVVIIAYSATGTTDIGNNPLFKQFLLSRIHSSALNTMLTRQFVTLIDEFPLVVPLAALVSIAFFIVCLSIRHRYAIIPGARNLFVVRLIVLIPFVWWSYDIPTSAPLLLFAVSATTFLVSRAISMESRADRVAGALQRYLSPQMLKSIVDLDHEIDLSTRRKELTILFVDIKGFTTMSETVEVEYLEGFLNDFLEAMTSAIFDCHGTVDKFLGDGLLAFFGDPIELENHALAAICAAEQMPQGNEEVEREMVSHRHT
jgi:adenylate cyclase